jgi:hypothetical protein
MDCRRCNELLVDYLYQELDPREADAFEAHLQGCARCTQELASLEATRSVARDLPELDPPAHIGERLVKEALLALHPPRPSLWERLRDSLRIVVMHPAMTAAVTLVVVVGISFYAYRQSSPPTSRPKPDEMLPEVVHRTEGAESGRFARKEAEKAATVASGEVAGIREDRAAEDPAGSVVDQTALERNKDRVVAQTADEPKKAYRRVTAAPAKARAHPRPPAAKVPLANQAADIPKQQVVLKTPADNRRYIGTRGLWKPGPVAGGSASTRATAKSGDSMDDLSAGHAQAAPQPAPQVASEPAPPPPAPRPTTVAPSASSEYYKGSGRVARRPRKRPARKVVAKAPLAEPQQKLRAKEESEGEDLGYVAGDKAKGKKAKADGTKRTTRADRDRDQKVVQRLTQARRATAARRCEEALRHYNEALRLEPGLAPKLAGQVQTCVAVVGHGGEGALAKAKKRYPMLARFLNAEIARVRAEQSKVARRRAKAKAKKAPPKGKKAKAKPKQAAPAADAYSY